MPYKNKAKRRAYKKRWAKKNTEKQKSYNKKYKQKVLDYYRELKETSYCSLCDETDVVEFHQLRDKEFSIYTGVKNGVSLCRLKKEVDKTIVLCRNCHAKVHSGLLNPNSRAKYEKILLDSGVNYTYEPKEVLDRNRENNLENTHNNPPKKSRVKPKKKKTTIKVIQLAKSKV